MTPTPATINQPVDRRRSPRRLAVVAALGLALGLLLTACGSDPSDSTGPVTVTLKEHTIDPSRTSAKAGSITFAITNDGTETHEFLVVKSDLDPKELPLDEEGAVDEKGDGLAFIDERENIKPGDSVSLTVDLAPGKYVLLCNLEDHYEMGMYKAFEVKA